MKTGTTYLQHLLEDNRDALASAGVLWPGERWREQTMAATDIMAASAGRVPRSPAAVGMWDRLAGQMREYPGRASVFSMEFLSYADHEQARRIVQDFPDHEVHVILTVRDAGSAVPAQWQTSCRMAHTVPLPRLAKALGRPHDAPNPGRAAKLLRRTQDVPRMLEVWAPLVGPERTHVITVPPKGSDPSLLWQRFATVLGVRPTLCSPPTSYIHTSLGHESTEFLRLLNEALGPARRDRRALAVKKTLVADLLTRTPEETPIRLHRRGLVLAARYNRQVRDAITASGAHVVGDLEDLRDGEPPPDAPRELYNPPSTALHDVAAAAISCLEEHRAWLLAGGEPEEMETSAEDDDPDEGDEPGEGDDGAVELREPTRSLEISSDVDADLRAAVIHVAELLLSCADMQQDERAASHA